jgi:site-specific recombinase XerD
MTPDAIRGRIKRIAEEAGITLPQGCPVHWFRHSFAKRALEAGLDLSQVGQLLGHRSPKTTTRYLQEYPVRLKALYDVAFSEGSATSRSKPVVVWKKREPLD